jgi:hypothetical protein
MNKEQQELLDEVYETYLKNWKPQPVIENELHWMEQELVNNRPLPKDMFIHCTKTDTEFSENCGLLIKERELSLEERYKIALPIWKEKYGPLANMMVPTNVDNTPYKIPTKQITLTYNDKTITSYE